MTDVLPTKKMELMLAGWRESHNSGFVVSFLVPPEDEEYFRGATARKGKIAGQRYMAVLVQLRDDDTPDPESVKATVLVKPETAAKPHFPGGLCGLAVRWCKDEHFQMWLAACLDAEGESEAVPETLTSQWARGVVLAQCGIATRKELDTNASAAEAFRRDILTPYAASRKEDGLDE